jgi:hypothetical protein
MTKFLDSVVAYRILKMLVTPFEETDAFKLGIIDAKGRELKKLSQLNTDKERRAYTILHRMVFRLKKIIEKVPSENKKLLTYTAALALIKEHYDDKTEPLNLEYKYLCELEKNSHTVDTPLVQQFLNQEYILSFKTFMEEAPANNAVATPGIAGFTPETIGVKKKKPKLLRRSEEKNATGPIKFFQKK